MTSDSTQAMLRPTILLPSIDDPLLVAARKNLAMCEDLIRKVKERATPTPSIAPSHRARPRPLQRA